MDRSHLGCMHRREQTDAGRVGDLLINLLHKQPLLQRSSRFLRTLGKVVLPAASAARAALTGARD